MTNSEQAIKELAENWGPTFTIEKGQYSDLTALISEHYYPKEKYDELLQQRDELREALRQLVHLHGCEQEGLLSGQPTPEQWHKAVEQAEAAIKNTCDSCG